jgi:hypothetical protein
MAYAIELASTVVERKRRSAVGVRASVWANHRVPLQVSTIRARGMDRRQTNGRLCGAVPNPTGE